MDISVWGGQKGFVYGTNGICVTLPATQYKDPTKILVKDKDGRNQADNGRKCE